MRHIGFTALGFLYSLSLAGFAHAQSAEGLREASRVEHSRSTSLTSWEGCMIQGLNTAPEEMRSEIVSLQSEADRAMCIQDGVAFATEHDGELRISIVAPVEGGEIGVTDQVLSAEDIVLFTWLASHDASEDTWCDDGSACTLGGQEGEDLRAVLDMTMQTTDGLVLAAGSDVGHRIGAEQAEGYNAYLTEVKFPTLDASSKDQMMDFLVGAETTRTLSSVGEDAQLANVDLQSSTGGVLPALYEGAYKAGLVCLNRGADDRLANVDMQNSTADVVTALYEGAYKAGLVCLNRGADDAQLANVDLQNLTAVELEVIRRSLRPSRPGSRR